MKLSRYIKIYPYRENPDYLLFYSTKEASSILLHKSLLDDIEKGSLSPSDKETLAELGFLVEDPNEEKNEMLCFMDNRNNLAKKFNAMVVMNLDCNLSCVYCYEEGLKGKKYMSPETAELLIKFMEKPLSEGKDIHIDFYGGEPLLSFATIKDISRKLRASAEARGLKYSFNFVTNGTLLMGGRVEELAALGMRSAKITLDGPERFHDISRPFKSGTGSFDLIIKNVKDALPFIEIQIGGNFTEETYGVFPELLDHLLHEKLGPEKFLMVKFDPVIKTAGAGLPDFREGSESINEPWVIEASIFLRKEILKRGFNTPKIVPSPCMVELRSDVVIHFDGTIYKCPGFIGRKEFVVGDLRTGVRDYGGSHHLGLWMNEECLDCEYLPLCFGGCRYMKFLRDGNIDGVDCRRPYLDAALESIIIQDIEYRQKAGNR